MKERRSRRQSFFSRADGPCWNFNLEGYMMASLKDDRDWEKLNRDGMEFLNPFAAPHYIPGRVEVLWDDSRGEGGNHLRVVCGLFT